MSLPPGSPRYQQAREPLRADFPGETVLLNLDLGRYSGLEGTAQAVWRLLEAPRSVTELVHALQETYDVDAEQCRRDLQPFLQAMLREGIITAVD